MHILVGNETIRLIYKALNKVMVNFTENLGAGIYCKSSKFLQFATADAGDTFMMNYFIHVLSSNDYNIKYVISFQMTFDATSGMYEMSSPYEFDTIQMVITESVVRTVQYGS